MSKDLSFFSKCNLSSTCEYTLTKLGLTIKLPFYFKLESIHEVAYNNDNRLSESLSYYKAIKSRGNMLEVLKDVYLELFFLDEALEGYDMLEIEKDKFIFTSTKELYRFLSEYLELTDIEFKALFEFILSNRETLMSEFVDIVEKELEIGSKSTVPSEAYMLLRCALELSSQPIFVENKGKAISEFSWRELLIQRIYLGRKCEIEKLMMDEVKNSKEKKK